MINIINTLKYLSIYKVEINNIQNKINEFKNPSNRDNLIETMHQELENIDEFIEKLMTIKQNPPNSLIAEFNDKLIIELIKLHKRICNVIADIILETLIVYVTNKK